jgi:UDP-2,4-diacetamido-2,4,6-trideoxy-beta-L-altropyranose hydrolase
LKAEVIIRADGSADTGMGHVVRCLALADMLKGKFRVTFAICKPDAQTSSLIREVVDELIELPVAKNLLEDAKKLLSHVNPGNIIVLDGYIFKTDYQESLLAGGCKLVCIDDLRSWHHCADAIINHAEGVLPGDYKNELYTGVYTGLEYVLLRKQFLSKSSSVKEIKKPEKVFISMGAADVNNLTMKFAEVLIGMDGVKEIHLMLGSVNPNIGEVTALAEKTENVKVQMHVNISATELYDLIRKCDVSICPASSISLESCATGIGLVTGFTADNQHGILNGISKFKAGYNLGNMIDISVEELSVQLKRLFSHPAVFNEMIRNQQKMIDGRSPERITEIFHKLAEEKLRFRYARVEDVDLYFKWANDPLVRENSFNQEPIVYSNHVKWFNSRLVSPDSKLFFFYDLYNVPAGQVRIEKINGEHIIGISIDQAFRGKGMGVEMLNRSTHEYFKKENGIEICALIKKNNLTSYKIFTKAGFTGDLLTDEKLGEVFRLIKKGGVNERY